MMGDNRIGTQAPATPDALPASKEAEAVAWLHEIIEPGQAEPMTMLSRSANNPWSHWFAAHLDKCTYVVTPLFAHPHTDAGVSEALETLSIADDGIGYAYERDGRFFPGKYDIIKQPVEAAEEIEAILSEACDRLSTASTAVKG